MPKLPIFRLRPTEAPPPPDLRRYKPALSFTDLQLGVDNLRYDVFLSTRFTADLSFHLSKYICRFGEVETLFDMEVASWTQTKFIRPAETTDTNLRKRGPADLKTVLISIHQAILTHAKAEGNASIDLLGRLAVLKFIRAELNAQFSKILEQCRTKSKAMEGVRQAKMMETQELVSSFQVRKKIIIRRAGQEVLRLLRVIEKETLARTRRSLLGDVCRRLLSALPKSAYPHRRWTRRLSLRRALLHVRQFRAGCGPFPHAAPDNAWISARTRLWGRPRRRISGAGIKRSGKRGRAGRHRQRRRRHPRRSQPQRSSRATGPGCCSAPAFCKK